MYACPCLTHRLFWCNHDIQQLPPAQLQYNQLIPHEDEQAVSPIRLFVFLCLFIPFP